MPDVRITVDGLEVRGPAGTSVAAMLMRCASGVSRRSVSGEPRGPLCGMGVCQECRVEIDGVPHQRACMIEAREGMRVRTAGVEAMHRAGGPPRGENATAPSQHRLPSPHTLPDSADIVVIGAGPAGIATATAAAESGAQVLVLDENRAPGGQIWRPSLNGHATDGRPWLARLTTSGASLHRETSIVDARRLDSDAFELLAYQAGTSHVLTARQIVLCTGARERFLPFPGWTLPGVVGAGGAQALMKSGAAVEGKRVVVAGTGPLLLAVAAALAAAGARLVLIVEQAPASRAARYAAGLWRSPATVAQAAAFRARCGFVRYLWGTWVTRADGDGQVQRVTITNGVRSRQLSCDLLCVGYGLVPDTRLARLLGCDVQNGAIKVDSLQRTTVPGVWAAGEPTGIGGVEKSLAEGTAAGLALGGREADAMRLGPRIRGYRASSLRLARAFALRDDLRALATSDTIVCRCEDVRFGAVESCRGFRPARVHSRLGMGACQGRICGDALSFLRGWEPEPARPPIAPVPLTALGTHD